MEKLTVLVVDDESRVEALIRRTSTKLDSIVDFI